MTYHKQRDLKTLESLDKMVAQLPRFCSRFFLGVSQKTTPLTRLGYAGELRSFFNYLVCEHESFQGKQFSKIEVGDLEVLEVQDIELFVASLHGNSNASKQRKLCVLRSFFAYLFKVGLITRNIMPNIDLPKIKEKPIIRLSQPEISAMLGSAGLEAEKKQSLRDETILVLFLSTGIRVSELVGLDVSDIDLESSSFKVTRKGGIQTILFLPDQCAEQLKAYLKDLNQGPLFRTTTGKRLGVRTIQKIVKHYASDAVPLKNITPHKLRSTFGTNLYRATGDIYVVADVLGHKDVNTTKKHYAAISDDIRKEAAKHVKLY